MIVEYDYLITVEIESGTEAGQAEIRKKFKQALFHDYGDNDEMRITGISLAGNKKDDYGGSVLSAEIGKG